MLGLDKILVKLKENKPISAKEKMAIAHFFSAYAQLEEKLAELKAAQERGDSSLTIPVCGVLGVGQFVSKLKNGEPIRAGEDQT